MERRPNLAPFSITDLRDERQVPHSPHLCPGPGWNGTSQTQNRCFETALLLIFTNCYERIQ